MGVNIYQTMWGPSEFTGTGILKDYERADRLGEIKVPTLLLGGEYDEVRSETLRYLKSRIPGAEYAVIPGAAHLTMQDNPAANLDAISGFLGRLENA